MMFVSEWHLADSLALAAAAAADMMMMIVVMIMMMVIDVDNTPVGCVRLGQKEATVEGDVPDCVEIPERERETETDGERRGWVNSSRDWCDE